jgi:hypothetical protein
MILSKTDFFTVHKGYNNKILIYLSGNTLSLNERQFNNLDNVIITLSGKDYSVKIVTVESL